MRTRQWSERVLGAIDDGLLKASWAFMRPDLSLAYSVDVPLEIVTAEGGDGRVLVTARAKDSRASVSVPGFWFSPQPAVEVQRCTIRQSAVRVGLGLLGGLAIRR